MQLIDKIIHLTNQAYRSKVYRKDKKRNLKFDGLTSYEIHGRSTSLFGNFLQKEMLLLELKQIEIGQNLRKSSDFWRYGEWANRATNMHYLSRKGKRVLEGSSEVGKADIPVTGKGVKVHILMEFIILGFTLAWNPFFSPIFPFGMRMSILWCVNPENWLGFTGSQLERNVPSGWVTACI